MGRDKKIIVGSKTIIWGLVACQKDRILYRTGEDKME